MWNWCCLCLSLALPKASLANQTKVKNNDSEGSYRMWLALPTLPAGGSVSRFMV
jgi:hypothetical protein